MPKPDLQDCPEAISRDLIAALKLAVFRHAPNKELIALFRFLVISSNFTKQNPSIAKKHSSHEGLAPAIAHRLNRAASSKAGRQNFISANN
jgi:hypothetical protein